MPKNRRGRPALAGRKTEGSTGAWAIRLPDELARALDELAARDGETRAVVVRHACREYVMRRASPTGEQKK